MRQYHVEATVRAEIKDGYRLKVSVLDLGLYMDGFRVTSSDKNDSGWWVQPPAIPYKGRWLYMPEFDKNLTLWHEIEQTCIEAIQLYMQPADEPENDDKALGDESKPTGLFPDDQDFGQRPKPYHQSKPLRLGYKASLYIDNLIRITYIYIKVLFNVEIPNCRDIYRAVGLFWRSV